MTRRRWLFGVLLAGACGTDDPPAPARPPADTAATGDTALDPCVDGPTWDTFTAGYLKTWCLPCHTASLVGPEARQGAPDGVDFDRWSQVVAWESRILARATGPNPDMPPLGGTDPADGERLAAWFACGAPGDDDPPGPCDTQVPTGITRIADPSDALAFCAAGNHADTLEIDADIDVPCLCSVDGALTVRGQASLPVLRSVGGDLVLDAPDLSAPELGVVGGDLDLTGAAVAHVSLPRLATVGGDVRATGPALEHVDLSGLIGVGGALTVAAAPVRHLDLSRLRDVGGSLTMSDLPVLATWIGAGAVDTIGGDLVLARIGALPAIDHFRLLSSVGGEIRIEDLSHVTRIDGFTVLPHLSSLTVTAMPSLGELHGFDNLAAAEAITITDNPSLTGVFGFVNLVDAGDLRLERLPAARSFAGFEAVQRADDLSIVGAPLPDLPWFTALAVVDGALRLEDLPQLGRTSGWVALHHVGGDLVVAGTPSLLTLDAGALTSLDGDLRLVAAPRLRSVDLVAGLATIGGDLTLEGTGLSSLEDLGSVHTIGGDLRVVGNPALPADAVTAFVAAVGVTGDTTAYGNGP